MTNPVGEAGESSGTSAENFCCVVPSPPNSLVSFGAWTAPYPLMLLAASFPWKSGVFTFLACEFDGFLLSNDMGPLPRSLNPSFSLEIFS